MAKPKSEYRKFIDKLPNGEFRCRKCQQKVSPNITRAKNHLLNKCPNRPQVTQSSSQSSTSASQLENSSASLLESSSSSVEASSSLGQSSLSINKPNSPPKLKRKVVYKTKTVARKWSDCMTPAEAEEVNRLYVRAQLGTFGSFRMLAHPLWKDFFKHLRPAWRQPSRFLCAGRLLDEENQVARNQLDAEIRATHDGIGISLDGWTNVNSDPILNIALLLPEPRYLKSVDTSNLKQDKDYLFKVIEDIILSVGHHKIVSINTDNAASMKAAADLITAKYPRVLFVGCAAHWLNLLIKDLCEVKASKPDQAPPTAAPSTVKTASKVRFLVNEIKRPGKLIQKFKEISAIAKKKDQSEGNLVTSFSPTRFAGCASSMDSVIASRKVIHTLVPGQSGQSEETVCNRVTKSYFTPEAEEIVKSATFWRDLTITSRLLKPIKEAIMKLQGDNKVLADVGFHAFDILEDTFLVIGSEDFPDKHLLRAIITARCEALLKPEVLAAYYLHPKYRGEKLSHSQRDKAKAFMHSFGLDFGYDDEQMKRMKNSFLVYRTNRDKEFNNEEARDELTMMNPLHWWHLPDGHEELKAIAHHLHSIVPSSAAIERYNSTNKLIHSDLRNRLSNPKTEKILMVNRWLHQAKMKTLEKGKKSITVPVPQLVNLCEDDRPDEDFDEDGESSADDELIGTSEPLFNKLLCAESSDSDEAMDTT